MSTFNATTCANAPDRFTLHSALSRHVLTVAIFAAGTVASQVHAAATTFEFTGMVSGLSDSDTFGGVNLGQTISGTLSYDQSSLPTKTFGTWSANYNLSAPDSNLSVALPGGQVFQLNAFGAKVFDGPVYPHFSNDQFIVGSTYLDPAVYAKSGQSVMVGLSFESNDKADSLTSSALPKSLDLSKMRYSGGILSVITGKQAPGDDIYIINRSTMAFANGIWDSPYSLNYVQRFSRTDPTQPSTYIMLDSYPGQSSYVSPDLERYRSWLAAGNTPLYLDALAFQMTSISTVPEPQSYALMAAGCMALLWLNKRRA